MKVLHVKPAPPLSRFVELVWYYEHPPRLHQKERLMPDGCIGLIVNLEENVTRVYDADDMNKMRKLNGCSVSGPHTKCFVIDTDEQTCVIGVSFRPAGAFPSHAVWPMVARSCSLWPSSFTAIAEAPCSMAGEITGILQVIWKT